MIFTILSWLSGQEMNRIINIIITILLIIPINISGQNDLEKKIEYNSDELNKIRKEITQYEKNLKKIRSEEKTLLSNLHETEKSISLSKKMQLRLNHERRTKEREIRNTTKSIGELEIKLQKLKDNFARRLVYLYKKGENKDLELFLTSHSINQAIYRYKYFKILKEIDKKSAYEIKLNITEISRKNELRKKELADKKKILNEQIKYQAKLSNQKKARGQQLSKAKKDKNSLIAQIDQKKQAIGKLSKLISKLESENEQRKKELAKQRSLSGIKGDNLFLKSQGKLVWPVHGKIISSFGLHKHPTLKTVTENSGIDIKVKSGTPVKAVLDGVVTTITYIRGFGNTIIIDHGSGFYTVYTHVDNVQVFENQYITVNSEIAQVGDSGSLSGSLLHFEIWNKKEKLNPEKWLAKRT